VKVVLDTMLWVSYCTRRHGSRHRLIDRALKARVRLFVSDYIVAGDPKDDAVVQTAISSKSGYLVTAHALLLELGKVGNVEIISVKTFAERLPGSP
jgi:predicted nucleic acid-binding protein